jgi:hypothetical protein
MADLVNGPDLVGFPFRRFHGKKKPAINSPAAEMVGPVPALAAWWSIRPLGDPPAVR